MIGFDAAGESWHLCWPGECDNKNALNFRNREAAAREWLEFLVWRAGASRRLRAMLELRERPTGQPLAEDALLQRVASLLATGRLNACKIVKATRTFQKIGTAPPFPLGAKPVAPSRESRVEDPPTFSASADAASIAAAKREAAALGIPFCEECMRERAAAGG